MANGIKKRVQYILTKQDERKYKKLVKVLREAIPENYNKIKLAEDLINPDIDWLISISNRTDGKTTNYINLAVWLAIELDLKFFLLARHFTLRQSYNNTLMDIFIMNDKLKEEKLTFRRTDNYTIVIYNGKTIGIISDINNASDLKLESNFLKNFPLVFYDEFLALEDDYVSDEYMKVKTIYESIDRQHGTIPFIKYPKIFLLGNAVNFSSPLLMHMNLFNKLETQAMNTKKTYGNIVMEMNLNERVNELRNTRAFGSFEDDPMTTGRFKFNNYGIVNFEEKVKLDLTADKFHIKLGKDLVKITYQRDNPYKNLYVSIVPYAEHYVLCTERIDKRFNVDIIDDTYYSEVFPKEYENLKIRFENSYSRDKFLNDDTYACFNIYKALSYYQNRVIKFRTVEEKHMLDEQQYEELQINETRKRIFNRFYGDLFVS